MIFFYHTWYLPLEEDFHWRKVSSSNARVLIEKEVLDPTQHIFALSLNLIAIEGFVGLDKCVGLDKILIDNKL